MNVTEQRNRTAREYASILTVTLHTNQGDVTLAGTSMRDEPHIVRVNNYWLDMTPSVPFLLFVENEDQPGSVGAVGLLRDATISTSASWKLGGSTSGGAP